MKHKYEIVVKQYQMFELETEGPITEDDFWSDMYDIGNCELDSHIIEMKETVGDVETTMKSTHPADRWEMNKSENRETKLRQDNKSLQSLIDVLWDYVSESDIPEITKRMEEE